MPGDKDLEAVGLPSTSTIQDLLDNAEDPKQAIIELQQNSLLLPSLKPVLKLLELHGIRRNEYNELVLNKLSDQLLEKIKELGNSKNPDDIRKLEAQLDRCFKLYHVPKIRPIVLETLARLPKVSSKFLKKIVEDHDFYLECGVSVKQQIWLTKDDLFSKAVGPICDSYIDDKERILTNVSRGSSNFFTCSTTKSRRQWKQIKELLVMIGGHEKLYLKLVNFLRERFVESKCEHYCSLRLELIMAIHDVNLDYATKIDKAHDLAWCLDACVRDHHVDIQQSVKLKALLDKKKLNEENIGDISFILADTHTIHFLCNTTLKIVCDNARKLAVGLPRENSVVLILLRLLYLGTSALKYANEEVLEQKAEIIACLTRFLPLLSQFVAKSFFYAEQLKTPDEVLEELSMTVEAQVPDANLIQFIKTDVVCSLLWFHYTLDLLSAKNRNSLTKATFENCLRVCCKSKDKVLMKDPWASLLTHHLIQSTLSEQHINDEHFYKIVVHDYFIRGINHNANSRFHLLHLLSTLMPHLTLEELPEKVLNALRQSGTLTAFAGRSSSKRFEKEFQQFATKVQEKPSVEQQISDPHPIEIPFATTADFLSTMNFD